MVESHKARPPAVDVVIPSYNGMGLLIGCLESVRSQTLPPARVIVVDDASTDDSCHLIEDRFPEVVLVRRELNGGFAAAVNTGIQVCSSELVALLNNDAVAHPGWLEHALWHLRDENVAAVASLMVDPRTGEVDVAGMELSLDYGPRARRYGEQTRPDHSCCRPCFTPCAGAAVYRRAVFDACGLFDEDFFAYNEDVDLGCKMHRRGLHTAFCSASAVDHLGGQSFHHLSDRQVYLAVRNELAVITVHVPTSGWWWAWPRLAIHLLRSAASYNLRHGKSRMWRRGWRDFLRQWPMWLAKRRSEAAVQPTDREPASPARRRLLVVAASNDLYGSDRCLLQALPVLVEAFDVTVAFPAPGPGTARAERAGAKVLLLPDFGLRRRHLAPQGMLPWAWHMWLSLWRLDREHRRQRFDVVYSNTLAAGVGPALRLLWRVPHLVYVHEAPERPVWVTKLLAILADRTSDLVVCNSRFSEARLVARHPPVKQKTVVIHPGVAVVAVPERGARVAGSLRISCPGRVHPGKGQRTLLEALAHATNAGRDWEVHLYGDQLPEYRWFRDDLVRFAGEHALQDRVHWHGFTDDLNQLYGEADVVVVPSEDPESFSLVCAEAQMMGLPVVATRPGGPQEIICHGETGFVVPARDPVALAEAVAALERDSVMRMTMGLAGRKRVTALFSRDLFVGRLRDALIGVATSRDILSPWTGGRMERRLR